MSHARLSRLSEMFRDEPDAADAGDVLRGAAAGALAGLAATWAMTRFQQAAQAAIKSASGEVPGRDADAEPGGEEGGATQRSARQAERDEGRPQEKPPATVQAATAVTRAVAGRELPEQVRPAAGQVMHYAFGTAAGAAYGAAAEVSPLATVACGMGFGAVLWATADEVVVPAAGLSDPPREQPVSAHLYGLAAHLVYGLVAELLRRVLRPLM